MVLILANGSKIFKLLLKTSISLAIETKNLNHITFSRAFTLASMISFLPSLASSRHDFAMWFGLKMRAIQPSFMPFTFNDDGNLLVNVVPSPTTGQNS